MSISFVAYKHIDGQHLFLDRDVNLSNDNAESIADTIGLNLYDESGSACGKISDLQDFILKCDNILCAIASYPDLDPALNPSVEAETDSLTVIYCGRREGYIKDTVERLRDLAVACQIAGYSLNWS